MKRFILIIFLFISIFYLTGRYYFNTNVIVNEYSIKDSSLPNGFNGFKIVHFSDTLYNSKITSLKLLVDTINSQKPDIVIFTGDLIKNVPTKSEKETLINSLNEIEANLFKYAILGDHDTNDVEEILKEANFNVIKEESKLIYYNDEKPIQISNVNLANDINNDYYKIGLIHKPDDFKDLKENNINIFFAGHSLGGQIRLPFINGIIKKDGARTYTNNYYKENGSILYVSFGIGNEKTNIRFLNKPSINVYRLYNN